jgi:hypothetical protein
MMKYSMTVAPANLTTEQMKNWMSGREVDFTDLQWTTLLKNFGVSSFLVNKMREAADRDKPTTTPLIDYLLSNPYEATGETGYRFYDDIKHFSERFPDQYESLQDMPVLGKILYNLYGGGAEKIMEQERKKYMENQDMNDYEDEYADYK